MSDMLREPAVAVGKIIGPYLVRPGRPHPLGATVTPDGVNFAFFSQHATGIELLIFDEHDDPDPVQVITLEPRLNKSFYFWHCLVVGLTAGHALRPPRGRPVGTAPGAPLQPEQGADRPVREGQHQQPVGPRRGLRPGGQPPEVAAQRRHRHERLRLGRRPASTPADGRVRSSTRCTSAGSRGTRTPVSRTQGRSPG